MEIVIVIGACVQADSGWMSYGHLSDMMDTSGRNQYNCASLLSNGLRTHGLIKFMHQSAAPDAFLPRYCGMFVHQSVMTSSY